MGVTVIVASVIGLITGVVLVGWMSRIRFRRSGGAFSCKVRSAVDRSHSPRWPRRSISGRWVHTTLLLHTGGAAPLVRALVVQNSNGPIAPAPGVRVRGRRSVATRLILEDGSEIEVLAPASSSYRLSGPFVVPVVGYAEQLERP
jgi:hypothetical protein